MKMNRSITYNTKTGTIKKIVMTIDPEELKLKDSTSGAIQLLDDIKKALLKDTKRANKEEKERNK